MAKALLVLACACLLLPAPAADASRAGRNPHSTCRLPVHARVVLADRQAEVYENAVERIFACAFAVGRSYLLGSKPEFSSQGGSGIDNVVLTGPMVAYEYSAAGREVPTTWTVFVRDVRNNRVLRKLPTGRATHPEAGFLGVGPTAAIVLAGNGDVAWIVQAEYEPLRATSSPVMGNEYVLEAAETAGVKVLAFGPGIEVSSLAVGGDRLYWAEGGMPASTVLG